MLRLASRAPACALGYRSMASSSSSNTNTNKNTNMARVSRMQQIVRTTNSWEDCWSQGMSPWDLGGITPILADLLHKNELPNGRALIPGCGSGYDVVALASPSRHVVGLDISSTAIQRAEELASSSPNLKSVEFICGDFFTYSPVAPFDFIFDYTFFCALDPTLRLKWGEKTAELLAPSGQLLTLMFPVDDHEGGPPYAVSREEYERALLPCGIILTYYGDNPLSPRGRKGREVIAMWKKAKANM